MERRAFLAGAAGLIAGAQQAGKVPRIGFLSLTSPSDRPPLLETFRQRPRELGWVEGQNIVIDYRYAEGRVDRLPSAAPRTWTRFSRARSRASFPSNNRRTSS
jgi:putative ABC transport system substrate-binding protein